MAFPESETLPTPILYVKEYLGSGAAQDVSRLQLALDDALNRMEQHALADRAPKSVIVEIIPDGASGPATGSENVDFTMSMLQEYLRLPGDSSRNQSMIDNALIRQGRDADTQKTIKAVIIRTVAG